MRKAYCLLNHTLTENQKNELIEKFSVTEIVYPSEILSKKWVQIPATESLDQSILDMVILWLQYAEEKDILIIQGEFGSTFYLVDYAIKKGLIPLHAVTERVCKETADGEVVTRSYVFVHKCFRKYKKYNKKDSKSVNKPETLDSNK